MMRQAEFEPPTSGDSRTSKRITSDEFPILAVHQANDLRAQIGE